MNLADVIHLQKTACFSFTWLHCVVARVVGPAELLGVALVCGRAEGTFARRTSHTLVRKGAGDNCTHTMEMCVYIYRSMHESYIISGRLRYSTGIYLYFNRFNHTQSLEHSIRVDVNQ